MTIVFFQRVIILTVNRLIDMLVGISRRGGERRIEVTAVRGIRDVLGIVNDLMMRTG